MKRLRKSFRYGEKGFTLIELLIVIAILGVISAIVVPNVARFTQSGQKAAAMQEMETVQTSIDATMADAAMVAVSGSPAVGPGDPASSTWTITDGTNSGDVSEFVRRDVDGAWTVGSDGLITAGKYKSAASSKYWSYASGNWTWTP